MKRILSFLLLFSCFVNYKVFAQDPAITQYKFRVDTSITNKTAPKSITPVAVGARLKELADLVPLPAIIYVDTVYISGTDLIYKKRGVTYTLPIPGGAATLEDITDNGSITTNAITIGGLTISNILSGAATDSVLVISPSGQVRRRVYPTGGGGSVTASNGLTLLSGDIKLGGVLNKNTDIELDAFRLKQTNTNISGAISEVSFNGDNSIVQRSVNNGGTDTSEVNIKPDSIYINSKKITFEKLKNNSAEDSVLALSGDGVLKQKKINTISFYTDDGTFTSNRTVDGNTYNGLTFNNLFEFNANMPYPLGTSFGEGRISASNNYGYFYISKGSSPATIYQVGVDMTQGDLASNWKAHFGYRLGTTKHNIFQLNENGIQLYKWSSTPSERDTLFTVSSDDGIIKGWKYRNNEAEDSVLTTDSLGNFKLKYLASSIPGIDTVVAVQDTIYDKTLFFNGNEGGGVGVYATYGVGTTRRGTLTVTPSASAIALHNSLTSSLSMNSQDVTVTLAGGNNTILDFNGSTENIIDFDNGGNNSIDIGTSGLNIRDGSSVNVGKLFNDGRHQGAPATNANEFVTRQQVTDSLAARNAGVVHIAGTESIQGAKTFNVSVVSGGVFESTNGTIRSFQGISGGVAGSMGTFTNHPFQLYTNNALRGTITATGRFLFGTAVDDGATRLQINGNASGDAAIEDNHFVTRAQVTDTLNQRGAGLDLYKANGTVLGNRFVNLADKTIEWNGDFGSAANFAVSVPFQITQGFKSSAVVVDAGFDPTLALTKQYNIIVYKTDGAAATINLPSASLDPGNAIASVYTIKCIGTNSITINAASGDSIDGNPSVTLNDGESITIVCALDVISGLWAIISKVL